MFANFLSFYRASAQQHAMQISCLSYDKGVRLHACLSVRHTLLPYKNDAD